MSDVQKLTLAIKLTIELIKDVNEKAASVKAEAATNPSPVDCEILEELKRATDELYYTHCIL